MGPDCRDPRAGFLGEAGGGEEESKESVFTARCSHLASGWREREREKRKKRIKAALCFGTVVKEAAAARVN